MNSWKVILATLVIYGTGVITGGLLVNFTTVRANARRANRQPVMQAITPWQVRNRDLLRRMERELDLTGQQRTNIEQILIASQERTRMLWRPIVPEMNHEMQTVHDQIRAQLDPTQQQQFDELLRQARAARRPDDAAGARRRDPNAGPVQATNAAAGGF